VFECVVYMCTRGVCCLCVCVCVFDTYVYLFVRMCAMAV